MLRNKHFLACRSQQGEGGSISPLEMSPFIPPELPASTSSGDCVEKRGRFAFSDCRRHFVILGSPVATHFEDMGRGGCQSYSWL